MPGQRRKRNKVEISAQVLNVAGDGAKKTQIMHGANLSIDQLEKYLKLLLRRGLLAKDPTERGVYSTTDAGMRYLREFLRCGSSRDALHEKKQMLQRYLRLGQ